MIVNVRHETSTPYEVILAAIRLSPVYIEKMMSDRAIMHRRYAGAVESIPSSLFSHDIVVKEARRMEQGYNIAQCMLQMNYSAENAANAICNNSYVGILVLDAACDFFGIKQDNKRKIALRDWSARSIGGEDPGRQSTLNRADLKNLQHWHWMLITESAAIAQNYGLSLVNTGPQDYPYINVACGDGEDYFYGYTYQQDTGLFEASIEVEGCGAIVVKTWNSADVNIRTAEDVVSFLSSREDSKFKSYPEVLPLPDGVKVGLLKLVEFYLREISIYLNERKGS